MSRRLPTPAQRASRSPQRAHPAGPATRSGVRPVAVGRRPPGNLPPVPKRQKKDERAGWLWFLLLLLLLLGGAFAVRFLLEKEEPPAPEPVAAGPATPKPAAKVQPKPKPKLVAAPKNLVPESQRELLLKAVQARAADLKTCGRPPGSPSRLLTRIGVSQPGPVKSVGYSVGDTAPRALTDCVRKKVLGWNFADVKLSSDVEILVSFSLE